jgi:hypothetical protein
MGASHYIGVIGIHIYTYICITVYVFPTELDLFFPLFIIFSYWFCWWNFFFINFESCHILDCVVFFFFFF